MNKFLQRAWEIEDERKGIVVYHGTKPAYHKSKQRNHYKEAAITLIVAVLVVLFAYMAMAVMFAVMPA